MEINFLLFLIIGVLLLIFFTLLIVFIVIFKLYNSLIKVRNDLRESKSSVDVILKNRHSTIPNLVSSVKEYMKHESEIFKNITKLKEQATNDNLTEKQRMKAETDLSTELSKITLRINNYPELKADKNVLHLQKSIVTLETKISASRRNFNATAKEYNNKVERFPTKLFAMIMNFPPQSYLEFPESVDDVNVSNLFKNS